MLIDFTRDGAPLLELFPVVMLFDRELRIQFASDTLSTYVPAVEQRPLLNEAFQLSRPRSIADYDDAVQHLNSLFLMISADGSFAIRGQLILYPSAGEELLVFCGAPWLSWMVSKHPETKLHLQDFAPQDVQLDQLFYMSTEARMVADLEALNAELQNATKQVEAAQAAKDAFFARMSHEMRTPLNGIVSAIALMRDELPTGKMAELLELSGKSSGNLMTVINYVLDVAKVNSEIEEPETTPFELPDLLDSVRDVVRAQALEKDLQLAIHCETTVPRWWRGDLDRLRQSLLNLLINAIKFTSAGQVKLRVEGVVDEPCTLRFEVQDTGAGIPKGEQMTIFEPFTRGSGVEESGTGLGLNIVRLNVESMGGKVGVSSAPGTGSTFWIEVPLDQVAPWDEPYSANLAENTPDANIRLRGHVLLVDDNETNLMLGTMLLQSLGLTVEQAASGGEAVSRSLEQAYDLVLMDISMPGMDGHEATRLIRLQRDADILPVVALSAYASSCEQAKSKSSGMNGYLTKPIQREQMTEVLSQWLQLAGEEEDASDAEGDPADPEPWVDLDVLEHLCEQIGTDNLDVVIRKFTKEAALRWPMLKSAADCEQLAREAHTLASTCRSFGLSSIADSLNRVESEAKSGSSLQRDQADHLGSALESGLQQLESAVAAMCETAG